MNQVYRKPMMPLGGIDPQVVARAEAALKALSSQFAGWLDDEIKKLDAAHAQVTAEGLCGSAGEVLYTRAHDLKGLGTTYGFPIVSRLAGSLCRVIETPAARAVASMMLVDSHISAIKAMIQDDIRDESHPMAEAVVTALDQQVGPRR